MASAFTLFGELKADTRAFEGAMYRADVLLGKTAQSVADLERKVSRTGDVTAVQSRKFDKLNDTLKAQRTRLNEAADAFQKGNISARQFASIVTQTERSVNGLNSRLSDMRARFSDRDGMFARFRSDLVDVSKYATLAATAIAGFAIKSASDIDNAKNKFVALEGSVEKANTRIQTLQKLSRENVGVNFSQAIQNFSQLEAIGNVGEESINKIITALGKLDVAFGIDNQEQFLRNLVQLFTQGFERQDFKEAIGRVPIFSQLLKSAFKTDDPATLKEMIASGKITLDKWISGIADAANNDQRLAGLGQTFSVKLSKAFENLKIASAPLGEALINAISPALDDVSAELAKPNPDLDAASKRIGERIGNQIAEGAADGLAKLKQSIADEFSRSDGEQALLPFADGLREGFIKNLQAKGLFPEKPLFADGFKAGMMRIFDWLAAFGERLGNQTLAIAKSVFNQAAEIGENIGRGIIDGLVRFEHSVRETAYNIAMSAVNAAKNALGIQSPSKVFFGIGKDTVQGFIDGISALQASAQGKMAALLDVSGIKTGKGDAAGIELLTSLIGDISRFNSVTKEQDTLLELTAGKYGKLNAEVRNRILLAAQEYDALNANKSLMEILNDLADRGVQKTTLETTAEKLKTQELLSGNEALKERILILARLADVRDMQPVGVPDFGAPGEGEGGTGVTGFPNPDEWDKVLKQIDEQTTGVWQKIGTPPPLDPWRDFWGQMKRSIDEWGASLPSIKEAIGTDLLGSLQQVGDVFANAVMQWDGTIGGFFRSVAQGFKQMAQQIIADLIRIAIYKAILSIIASAAGGAAGGGGGAGSHEAAGGMGGGHAEGGLITGPGTGTSDSIPAMLSNGEFVVSAKAVKRFGANFFGGLNNLSMPRLSFATGGLADFGGAPSPGFFSASSAAKASTPAGGQTVINFSPKFYPNENGQFSKQSAEQAANRMAAMMERNSRRNNERF